MSPAGWTGARTAASAGLARGTHRGGNRQHRAMTDQIQAELFEDAPGLGEAPVQADVPVTGVARVLRPNWGQLKLRACDLESSLPGGHRARRVWASIERADVSGRYVGIRAVEGGSGRTAAAPEILFALWLYATLEGVGSAHAGRVPQASA